MRGPAFTAAPGPQPERYDNHYESENERIRPDDWTRDRDDYFDKLGPDALRLLKSEDLVEIEAHVAEVTGSGRAHLLFTVCPPM